MVILALLVYLLGFVAALYITHTEEDTEDHENVSLQCLAWPLFLVIFILLLTLRIPEYISKLVKKLVK
jgi:uncharacterized membrane protein YadS